MFEKGVHDSGARLAAADFVRVGVECEIAVKLARDMPPSEAPFTAEWVAEAIEAYYPAIEIVDDRYVKWETMGAPTLVADDFFAAGCVLGDAVSRTRAPDLLGVTGRAIINGKKAGQGTGADVLGHPHNALAWLANHLAAEGKGLHAGQIVLTGSLVKTVWLNAGDKREDGIVGAGECERDLYVKRRSDVGCAAPPTQDRRPRAGGDPIRCGFPVQSLPPLEYWVVRSSRTMTVGVWSTSTVSRSRGWIHPSFARNFLALQSEGAGNAGRPMRPIAACAMVVGRAHTR